MALKKECFWDALDILCFFLIDLHILTTLAKKVIAEKTALHGPGWYLVRLVA